MPTQSLRFVIKGVISTALDALAYLLAAAIVHMSVAKALGYLILFSDRLWSFGAARGGILSCVMLSFAAPHQRRH